MLTNTIFYTKNVLKLEEGKSTVSTQRKKRNLSAETKEDTCPELFLQDTYKAIQISSTEGTGFGFHNETKDTFHIYNHSDNMAYSLLKEISPESPVKFNWLEIKNFTAFQQLMLAKKLEYKLLVQLEPCKIFSAYYCTEQNYPSIFKLYLNLTLGPIQINSKPYTKNFSFGLFDAPLVLLNLSSQEILQSLPVRSTIQETTKTSTFIAKRSPSHRPG